MAQTQPKHIECDDYIDRAATSRGKRLNAGHLGASVTSESKRSEMVQVFECHGEVRTVGRRQPPVKEGGAPPRGQVRPRHRYRRIRGSSRLA